MAIKYHKVAPKLAAIILVISFAALNIISRTKNNDLSVSSFSNQNDQPTNNIYQGPPPPPPDIGYFNLSCPFEWSKYSCAYMQRGPKAEEIVRASTEYYLEHVTMIQSSLEHATMSTADGQFPKRILFTGDSLMRQIFIGIACNAATILPRNNLIEAAAMPWKDEWPCKSKDICFVTSGIHGGFDAASIRLKNGLEIHFVPHRGFKDDETSESNILERLRDDLQTHGRITFGDKTAMPPGGTDVDVLVYNVGLHYGTGMARKMIHHFVNWISKPLMGIPTDGGDGNNDEQSRKRRTKTIYITTPTQHYNTPNGQWQKHMNKDTKQCIPHVNSNPRAELENEILHEGVNVDVLLDYDDLGLGKMHVRKGHDCSHYCMPGVPDVVGARLLEELL